VPPCEALPPHEEVPPCEALLQTPPPQNLQVPPQMPQLHPLQAHQEVRLGEEVLQALCEQETLPYPPPLGQEVPPPEVLPPSPQGLQALPPREALPPLP